jgi:hypothetical protein
MQKKEYNIQNRAKILNQEMDTPWNFNPYSANVENRVSS